MLSQSPIPLQCSETRAMRGKGASKQGLLSYTEGCYSGMRTLQATNLWPPLNFLTRVDTLVSY